MKMSDQIFLGRENFRRPWFLCRWAAAVSVLFLPIDTALAQDVISSPAPTTAVPAAVQEVQNSSPMQVFAPPPDTAPPLPLQLGPITLHPHLDYQLSYGNGIQSSPGQARNTIINQVSPGILFNLGKHWTLDYTPTLFFYSSSSFQNVVNQSVRLGWGSVYGADWFFSGSQSYSSSSNPEVETAAQTDQETFATALNASYQFNEKMSLDMGLNQDLNYVGNGGNTKNQIQNQVQQSQNLANSKSWSTLEWLNYQFWPRFNAGLGAGFGYNQQDNSPDSIYEQYQVRVNWRATDKVSFQLSGGLQDQQYLSGGASDLLTPIFGGTIQYQPFEQTKLSVTASRTVSNSSFQNQVTINTGITADLNQRLLGKLNLDLSGGYATTEYQASASGLSTSRNDNLFSFGARLSCPLLKRATVSVFYAYSNNASSQSGFATAGSGYGYTSSQGGLEIGYQY
jgi:Putative beta-barrel porin 2